MIYAIADLHLPSTLGKTMDRFGDQWIDHPKKLRVNWERQVRPEDSVLVCGDISWALRPEEARSDLAFIASLPGTKYLIRGNHDFWWSRSATQRIQRSLPDSMVLLQGEGVIVEGIAVGGTRGWQVESRDSTAHDAKIIRREVEYLHASFRDLPVAPRLAMLHYPPYNPSLCWNEFGCALLDLGVQTAVFGHLHSGNPNVLQGIVDGLDLQLVAADQVDFIPQLVRLPAV